MTKKIICMVLINPHKTPDARNICDVIEGTEFKIPNHSTTNVLDELFKRFHKSLTKDSQIMVAELSDFTTMCNDEEINLSNYFITHVNVTIHI